MLFCVSASHKTANLPLLEALNIKNEAAFVDALRNEGQIEECLLLQTCHRVELYFYVPQCKDKDWTVKEVQRIWSATTYVSVDIITKTTRLYLGRDVLEHAFFLASGLESVIIGEDQILGQIRNAFHAYIKNGSAGSFLARLFMKAINVGKLVRTRTKINEGSISISSTAVDIASNILGDLSAKKALVIGAGEAGTLAAVALKSQSVTDIIISNRTHAKSEILAKKVDGKVCPFEKTFSAVSEADLIISGISVNEPLLTKEVLMPFFLESKELKPKLLLDISQPRSVDESVALLPGIEVKTIEDINHIISCNIKNRALESEKVKEIINKELIRFEIELSKLAAQPLVDEICRNLEIIRREQLGRALRKMVNLDEKNQAVLERFSRELVERIAQHPVNQLRKAAIDGDSELFYGAKKLFQIDDPK